ncbi:hypothetical protein CLV40_103418 [Actinokineospora auranticolor]|uniref:Tetratricopeptide repeat protein n=2 Tax=Actinokineospora auranticolor TaxID=155976 RepID=A0A2S6GX81_9PSEU|nr:hypothetical protein CLV40_103418 [Actinokineospora auranticolor]
MDPTSSNTDDGLLDSLLEAAHRHRLNGKPDRALTLLHQAISLGGEDRAYARATTADLLFSIGEVEGAREQLHFLRTETPVWSAPCQLVAEMAGDRGELPEALSWYDLALANLPEEDMAEMDGPNAGYCFANSLLNARNRVRRAMDRPLDDWDNMTIDFKDR